jgi:hypothetical protein
MTLETATETPGGDPDEGGDGDPDDEGGDGDPDEGAEERGTVALGPGFGALAAGVAAVAGSLVAARRRQRD